MTPARRCSFADDHADDKYLYAGVSDARGSAMVGPAGSELIGRAADEKPSISEKRRKVLEVREDAGKVAAPLSAHTSP